MEGMIADGILGMAFPILSEGNPTLIWSMYTSNLIESPIFSVYLSDNDYGMGFENLQSMVIFGGYDLDNYTRGDLQVLDVISQTYWVVRLTKLKIGGTNIGTKVGGAILDTGTSLLVGPEEDTKSILKYISKAHNCYTDQGITICKCKSKEGFPEIIFELDQKQFVIMPEEYLMKIGDDCIVLIQGMNLNFWILGDVFLRSYYTYYDMENLKIGIARSSTSSEVKISYDYLTGIIYFTFFMILVIIIIFVRWVWIKRNNRNSNRRIVNQGPQYINMTNI